MKRFSHSLMGTSATMASFVLLHQGFIHTHQTNAIVAAGMAMIAAGAGGVLPGIHGNTKKILNFLGIGSMLPDIDIFLGIFGIKHRSVTHSLIMVLPLLVITILFYFKFGISLPYCFSFGVLIGVICHLLGDMMTRSGICLLFPSAKRYHILPSNFLCETGSLVEYLYSFAFSIGMVLATASLVLWRLPSII
jgi:membrane-bound metal-dependent hydrolase YbcI (DUF457 family)